jgi:4-hydroxybenzoate polyprenyltransferase
MVPGKTDSLAFLRTLLVLGRTSNLPTVWSNCLAGWLLGGGGNPKRFLQLCLGATLLYTGGMYLNDACDVGFDARYRRERPIPSGAIRLGAVFWYSFAWLAVGWLILWPLGKSASQLSLILVACIVVYDLVHKWIPFSALLMAACRFLLYLVAASAAVDGVTGWTLWSALALAGYVIGLSCLARVESNLGALGYWPAYLLGLPILLAWFMNEGNVQKRALLLSALLAVWILKSLRYTFWQPDRSIGRTVSGLLAGIVFVDLLAVAPDPYPVGLIFLLLFGLAILFQRFIPAT